MFLQSRKVKRTGHVRQPRFSFHRRSSGLLLHPTSLPGPHGSGDIGAEARKFRYEIGVSMLGVNIGVAAPMAFFPFGGAKQSFFGDLKAHGKDAIRFYTDAKVVITRWD